MKKNKIIIIIVVVLLILSGIGFGIYKIIDSVKQDSLKVQAQVEEINEYYDSLNNNAKLFNEKKQEYDTLMDKMYYTTVSKYNSEVLKVLKEYDAIIKNIIEDGNNLQEKCSVYYRDADTMQKCNSYKISYESAMNVFISDVKRYNNFVENYNKWTKENTSYKEISNFVSENLD